MEFTTTTQQKNEISLFLNFSNYVTSTKEIRQQMSTQKKNLNNTTLVILLKCTDQLHLSINPCKGHRLHTSFTSQHQKCEPQVVHHPSPPIDNDEDHRLCTCVTSLHLTHNNKKRKTKWRRYDWLASDLRRKCFTAVRKVNIRLLHDNSRTQVRFLWASHDASSNPFSNKFVRDTRSLNVCVCRTLPFQSLQYEL